MNNITIVSIDKNLNNVQLEPAKKLKVRPSDYQNVIEVKRRKLQENKYQKEVIKPEPVPSFEEFKKEAPIEKEKFVMPKEEPKLEVKEEIKEEKFSTYGNYEEKLKNLNAAWKEPEVKVVKEEPKEEKKKVSISKDFENVIFSEFYSEKTKTFMAPIVAKYNEICDEISTKQEEIKEIATRYNKEIEIGSKLDEEKKKAKKMMEHLNSLDVELLKEYATDLSKKVLLSMNDLFEDEKQKYIKATQDKEESDSRKDELRNHDERARSEYAGLLKDKEEYANSKYQAVKEVKKQDETLKAIEEQLTESTGIKEERRTQINNFKTETNDVIGSFEPELGMRSPVSKIENLAEKRNTILDIPSYNHFDSLREEEPRFGRVA